MPSSLVILPVHNNASKVQLARISHVYQSHPDLNAWKTFAQDFGFEIAAESDQAIYFRGYGRDPYACVASQSTTGEKEFGGAAFVARTEEDFMKATSLENASIVDLSTAPGGGKMVTIPTPGGSKIHVVFGQEERPLPTKVVSKTEVHKGELNTSLAKLRKVKFLLLIPWLVGEFQRFKPGPAMIHKLGHYGFISKSWDEDVAFYTENFNFVPSDVLHASGKAEVDILTFLHLDLGKEFSDHHSLFLARAPPDLPATMMHHTSYEVDDFDTQLLGHEYLLNKGYQLVWGVGRHILGSQIFDYWKDTSGFTIEHYADGDIVNEDTKVVRQEDQGPNTLSVWGPKLPEVF
ncbi:Metapyrocatechase 2 [Lachnellula cervina]|uniref:Metapyrocatechase 2 n=1 Tax=Lachnellula cervina TaxID=1316786 RepID=A0A7D8YYE3_9HELO|nr:Metapyrocatechase 2 [Lachnellula cervina]